MPRHRLARQISRLPEWVKTEANECLVSVAEDAYKALSLAIDDYQADQYPSCAELLRAGEKSLDVMANANVSYAKCCAAGDRAARKFWSAKACAKRCAGYVPVRGPRRRSC